MKWHSNIFLDRRGMVCLFHTKLSTQRRVSKKRWMYCSCTNRGASPPLVLDLTGLITHHRYQWSNSFLDTDQMKWPRKSADIAKPNLFRFLNSWNFSLAEDLTTQFTLLWTPTLRVKPCLCNISCLSLAYCTEDTDRQSGYKNNVLSFTERK